MGRAFCSTLESSFKLFVTFHNAPRPSLRMRDPQTLSPIDALQTLEPNFFIVRCGEIIKNIHTLHVRTFLHVFFCVSHYSIRNARFALQNTYRLSPSSERFWGFCDQHWSLMGVHSISLKEGPIFGHWQCLFLEIPVKIPVREVNLWLSMTINKSSARLCFFLICYISTAWCHSWRCGEMSMCRHRDLERNAGHS